MTDIMASVLVDVHLSKAKLTLDRDGNCLIIASTVTDHCLRGMLLRVVVDGSMRSLRNALYDCRSSIFDKAFQAMWAKPKPNLW